MTTTPVAPCLTDADVIRLVAILGHDDIALLVWLLESIMNDSGFGAIEIVLAGGRVQNQKRVQSFRARGIITKEE